MEIPAFDEYGNLPEGTWVATIEEVEERFGRRPSSRRMQIKFLLDAIEILKAAGCSTLFLDGSFVTAKFMPGDFDALILKAEGTEVIKVIKDRLTHLSKKYKGEFYCAEDLAYCRYQKKTVTFLELFQTDKHNEEGLRRKGIIQIMI